eukprot:gene43463-57860_t
MDSLIEQLSDSVASAKTLEDLAQLDSIAMSAPDGRSTWNLIGPGGVHQVVQHTPRYVADDLLTLKFAAVAGTGVCWMPDYMCQDEMRERKLVRVLPDWAPAPAIVHAVFPSRRGLSPAVRRFLDFLGDAMPGRSSLSTRQALQGGALCTGLASGRHKDRVPPWDGTRRAHFWPHNATNCNCLGCLPSCTTAHLGVTGCGAARNGPELGLVTASHSIDQDIRQARAHPAVRAIVIPPCPESLLRLQQIMAEPELDAAALEQLAASDVALAAAVMRLANSPLYGLAQPVQTVGMALTVLGLRPAVELMSAFIT